MKSGQITNLFFCRTPLQVKIINKILEQINGDHFVIYHPAGNGKKHRYYFTQLDTNQKYFLQYYNIRFLNNFLDFIYFYFLPKKIRQQKYKNFFFASITSSLLSMLERRVENKDLNLFDDGSFNINKKFFFEYINLASTARINSFIRKLFNLKSPNQLIENISCHYSIYDKKYTEWMNCEHRKINILAPIYIESYKKIRVLLGSTDDLISAEFESLINSDKFDIFLPHPDSCKNFWIKSKHKEDFKKLNFTDLIVEDLIYQIIKKGYSPTLYGFQSSAIINLSPYINTVCFSSYTMPESIEISNVKAINSFGIKRIVLDKPNS